MCGYTSSNYILNVTTRCFCAGHFRKQDWEEGSILCRKYLCREEGRRIKWIQRYSWKEKKRVAKRKNLMSPPQAEPLTLLKNNKFSCPTASQTPALTSAIYHHLPCSQHMGWLLMEGNPHSKAQTWAHWLIRSRGESSPAANCGELTKHPHWDHTAPLQQHLCYSSAVHWGLLEFWFVWCSPNAERNYEGREKEKYAFQFPNHLPQNAPCISTDFIICLLLQILFKE